jgi:hypothetical protein
MKILLIIKNIISMFQLMVVYLEIYEVNVWEQKAWRAGQQAKVILRADKLRILGHSSP